MEVNSVSFGAIPINKVKIKKFDKAAKRYADYPATFVKLDSYNKGDIDAVDTVSKKWKEAKYIQQISTAAHWIKDKPIEVYALTSQQGNFEKLQANRILGLAEIRLDENSKNTLLHYLQVRPGAKHVNQKHKINYKYVGTTILKSLKNIYNDIYLTADNDNNVIKFYKKNGFIDDFDGSRHFVWSISLLKRLSLRIRKFRLETGI